MTIRTGKSGRYRYYACSIKARQGETGCKGRPIPMDKLDDMLVNHIEERLLDPDRLDKLLGSILGRREDQAERRDRKSTCLNSSPQCASRMPSSASQNKHHNNMQ